jgi:transposase InsO family protein
MTHRKYSQRRACALVRVARSSARYQSRIKPEEVELTAQIRQLANRHQAYGCPRITALLRREGCPVNHQRVHRLWKLEGLQLPRRRPRKQRWGPKGEVVHQAEYYNHVWSYDFLEDRTYFALLLGKSNPSVHSTRATPKSSAVSWWVLPL